MIPNVVVFSAIAVVVVIVALLKCLNILREYERAVVFRLGRLKHERGPGLVFIFWPFETLVRVSLAL